MPQRDNAAVMVLHDSLASDERQSVTQPISAVTSADELTRDDLSIASELPAAVDGPASALHEAHAVALTYVLSQEEVQAGASSDAPGVHPADAPHDLDIDSDNGDGELSLTDAPDAAGSHATAVDDSLASGAELSPASASESSEVPARAISETSTLSESAATASTSELSAEAAMPSDALGAASVGAQDAVVPSFAAGEPLALVIEHDAAVAARRFRPTLMGLAPVELATSSARVSKRVIAARADAARRTREQADSGVETSTVRATHLLASDQPLAGADESALAAEAAERSLVATGLVAGSAESGVQSTQSASASAEPLDAHEDLASVSVATASAPLSSSAEVPSDSASVGHAESPVACADAGTGYASEPGSLPDTESLDAGSASASAESQSAAGLFPPLAAHARVPEEGDPEWLDLSTRWLVATGPQTTHAFSDDAEVTGLAQWADRVSARNAARTETRSSAPPPPPQQSTAAPRGRRVTMAIPYGQSLEGAAGRPSNPGTAAFDPAAPRPWAPAARRDSTLAGISPLPEDRSAWPALQERRDLHAVPAGDGARAGLPGEPNPYSDAPPPGPAAGYAVPPWAAAMSPYAMPPYAPMSWNGQPLPGAALPQPWAAPAHFAPVPHPQYLPPGAYGSVEQRPGQPNGRQSSRTREQEAGEVTFEQWRSLANTWLATLAKCGIAALALHYSGLAVPLLALVGYAPASGGANDALVRPAAAATFAGASIMPEPVTPAASGSEAPTSTLRRRTAKREVDPTSEEGSARRHSPSANANAKATHKSKLTQTARARARARAEGSRKTAEATTAPVAESVEATEPTVAAAEPLVAAAPPERDDATGEALLRINSRPWSQIFVDGTLVGNTPKLDLRVSAGAHRIRLVNPDLGLSKTVELHAAAGATVSHVELLDQ